MDFLRPRHSSHPKTAYQYPISIRTCRNIAKRHVRTSSVRIFHAKRPNIFREMIPLFLSYRRRRSIIRPLDPTTLNPNPSIRPSRKHDKFVSFAAPLKVMMVGYFIYLLISLFYWPRLCSKDVVLSTWAMSERGNCAEKRAFENK